MLRNKEIKDREERENNQKKLEELHRNKKAIQCQIEEASRLREEAYAEYCREKEQVDAIVQRMIDEDNQYQRIMAQKKEQAQADMILSQNEKRQLLRRQKEMEAYEDEMVRRYAEQQQARMNEIQAQKDAAEAIKDAIFRKLEEEEQKRRAEAEFQERLRNELYD